MNQPDGLGEDRALSGQAGDADARQPTYGDNQPQFTHFTQHFLGLAWIKNRQGRYVYVNEAALQVFGTAWSDVVGRTDDELFPAAVAAQFSEKELSITVD